MRGFLVALALHDEYGPTSEPSTVALVRTLMADVSPISERTPDPSRVLQFPHHFSWFETDPATGIAVQRGIKDLLGTADERALCYRQLLDAGKPIKQLYHRMFLLNATASAHRGKLLNSFTELQTPVASPFSPEQSYYESDVARSKIAPTMDVFFLAGTYPISCGLRRARRETPGRLSERPILTDGWTEK